MVNKIQEIKKDIYQAITKAYKYLFNEGKGCFFWTDVRSTALVGIALSYREPYDSQWLIEIKKWLKLQLSEIDQEKKTWNEQIWDTALALLCLNEFGDKNDKDFKMAMNWLLYLYNHNNRNNWHDEPWETAWALIAILKSNYFSENQQLVKNAFYWLKSLQNEEGNVVSPHYTAYYIMIINLLLHEVSNDLTTQESSELQQSQINAVNYLNSILNKDILWTGEPWSNGQILWALAESGNIFLKEGKMIEIIEWFIKTQESVGSWEDYEDTASTIIGLIALLNYIEKTNNNDNNNCKNSELIIYNMLRRLLATPIVKKKRKFIEKSIDGYTIISISPSLKKWIGILLPIIGGISSIIGFWQQITDMFGG
ncbi:hypothetical protein [Candidatus Harpocratesius sp.]